LAEICLHIGSRRFVMQRLRACRAGVTTGQLKVRWNGVGRSGRIRRRIDPPPLLVRLDAGIHIVQVIASTSYADDRSVGRRVVDLPGIALFWLEVAQCGALAGVSNRVGAAV